MRSIECIIRSPEVELDTNEVSKSLGQLWNCGNSLKIMFQGDSALFQDLDVPLRRGKRRHLILDIECGVIPQPLFFKLFRVVGRLPPR
jgi:hypothetical protein